MIEVPVEISYETEKPNKKNPLKHGLEIISNLLKLVTEERPILLLGMPGLILTAIGLAAAIYTVWIFNQTRYFSIPITLIALGFTLIGALLVITSLILYAIANIRRHYN